MGAWATDSVVRIEVGVWIWILAGPPHQVPKHPVAEQMVQLSNWGGQGYFGRGNFWGRKILFFGLVPKFPPKKFLCSPGHFLLPESADSIFLL